MAGTYVAEHAGWGVTLIDPPPGKTVWFQLERQVRLNDRFGLSGCSPTDIARGSNAAVPWLAVSGRFTVKELDADLSRPVPTAVRT